MDGDRLEPDSRMRRGGTNAMTWRKECKGPAPASQLKLYRPSPIHSQLPDETVATDHTGKTSAVSPEKVFDEFTVARG